PGMFAGYWGDPAADADRMRGGRCHSGDLAYVDDDEWVYFAGRSGGWMRVDGENLAAAPIEQVLRRHPAVAEVGVYAVPASAVRGPGAIGDAVAAALVVDAGGAAGGAGGASGEAAGSADGEADGGAGGQAAGELVRGLGDFLAAQPDLGPKQWPSLVRVTSALPRTASFKFRARDLVELGTDPAGDRLFLRDPDSGVLAPLASPAASHSAGFRYEFARHPRGCAGSVDQRGSASHVAARDALNTPHLGGGTQLGAAPLSPRAEPTASADPPR